MLTIRAFAGEHLVTKDWTAMVGKSVNGDYADRITRRFSID
jgi:hypothetical protein